MGPTYFKNIPIPTNKLHFLDPCQKFDSFYQYADYRLLLSSLVLVTTYHKTKVYRTCGKSVYVYMFSFYFRDELLDGDLDETAFDDLDGEQEDALLADDDFESYNVCIFILYTL